MIEPLVSIIVPIYKVEPYLRRCLDSIVNQTYTNLEIILVDDGSPDDCPQICDEYAAKDIRITVIHKDNGGLSDARNTGTLIAKGDYIYYIDSDDELPLDSISIMINQLQKSPETEVIIGKMYCPDDEDMYKGQLFDSTYIFNNNRDLRAHFLGPQNKLPVNACNKLVSRKFLLENNIFFKKGIIHEDNLWMFLVVQKAKYVICINQNTYIRYLNPGSIMTASSDEKRNESWGIILKEIFNNIDSVLLKKQFLKYFNQYNDILSHITEIQKKLYQEVWQSIVDCARRNRQPLLATSLIFHKFFYRVLKGHGTGFAIWFLLTKIP